MRFLPHATPSPVIMQSSTDPAPQGKRYRRDVVTSPSLADVLRNLRNPAGGPGLHVRVLAGLVVFGLAVLSAPAIIPVLRFLVEAL